jgi:hypothetical protein
MHWPYPRSIDALDIASMGIVRVTAPKTTPWKDEQHRKGVGLTEMAAEALTAGFRYKGKAQARLPC